ncbi:MAG: hypothetical protein J7M38_11780 [Armatimonadetes bacterium]|nr:hypothetical protein [Armatimonadota bacterium]
MNRRKQPGRGGLLQRLRSWWLRLRAPGRFLCDSCVYDWGDVCRRPERPNATRCDDYKPR